MHDFHADEFLQWRSTTLMKTAEVKEAEQLK